MLSWRHFVVHDGVGHAKLPHLDVKIHEDGFQFWSIQTLLLPFQGKGSQDSPPARDDNGPLHVVFSVDEEELLLWAITLLLVSLRVAQQPEQTAAFAIDGIHRTKMRRFLVEGLSLLGHEYCLLHQEAQQEPPRSSRELVSAIA